MFAILLSEKMDPFYQNISSFPTVIFTFILILCVFYWLIAVLGLVDIDVFDVDLDIESAHSGGEPGAGPDAMAGMLLKFGLHGVPLTIIISFIALFGWLLSYYAVYFINPLVPGRLLEILVGIPVFVTVLYVSVMITAQIIKPLRPLFKSANASHVKNILGQVAVVRTPEVTEERGEAVLEDGGAGLILKIRAGEGEKFKRNDRVVLLEYNKSSNTYRVVSEEEFNS